MQSEKDAIRFQFLYRTSKLRRKIIEKYLENVFVSKEI